MRPDPKVTRQPAAGQAFALNEVGAIPPELHTRDLLIVIDGLSETITTGVKGDVRLDFSGHIVAWTLLADQSGSIQVDIWKAKYGSFPPTVADTITAGAPPVLSSQASATDRLLVGWTKRVQAGETLRFNVDSVSTVTRVTLALKIRG